MAPAELRPAESWYALAERCYAEEHQACPSCRQQHCVFRSRWGARTEYHCTSCDFSAARDAASGEAVCVTGETLAPRPELLASGHSERLI